MENVVAADPEAHPVVPGTKGVRKARWAPPGTGKRGGVRLIYYFWTQPNSVVLITVYAKNEKGIFPMPTKRKSARSLKASPARTRRSRVARDIVAGLKEAVAFARGEMSLAVRIVSVPESVDVKAIRSKLGLSQSIFAAQFGFSLRTVQDWEQCRSQPDSAVRAYLTVIDRNPAAVQAALA